MTNSPCYFFGERIGRIDGCGGGGVVVRTCLSPDVLSSLCIESLRGNHLVHDGPLQLDAARRETPAWRLVWSYDASSVERGMPLDPDWILVCRHCPFHRPAPPEVQQLYLDRERVLAAIREYESTDSLEAREAAIHRLTQTPPVSA